MPPPTYVTLTLQWHVGDDDAEALRQGAEAKPSRQHEGAWAGGALPQHQRGCIGRAALQHVHLAKSRGLHKALCVRCRQVGDCSIVEAPQLCFPSRAEVELWWWAGCDWRRHVLRGLKATRRQVRAVEGLGWRCGGAGGLAAVPQLSLHGFGRQRGSTRSCSWSEPTCCGAPGSPEVGFARWASCFQQSGVMAR